MFKDIFESKDQTTMIRKIIGLILIAIPLPLIIISIPSYLIFSQLLEIAIAKRYNHLELIKLLIDFNQLTIIIGDTIGLIFIGVGVYLMLVKKK